MCKKRAIRSYSDRCLSIDLDFTLKISSFGCLNNMKYMNWAEEDIEGVAWFMGIYTRVALKAGYTNSFADFIMPAMKRYYEVINER